MGPVAWLIFGALAGWVASILTGRNERMGCITNIVVGIVGAFVGGLLMNFIGGRGVTGFNLYSFIVAVIGAVVLLALVGFFQKR